MSAFLSYLKNVRAELKHVVWPNRRQTVIYTILIVVISTLVALYISGLDYAFTGVVNRLVTGY